MCFYLHHHCCRVVISNLYISTSMTTGPILTIVLSCVLNSFLHGDKIPEKLCIYKGKDFFSSQLWKFESKTVWQDNGFSMNSWETSCGCLKPRVLMVASQAFIPWFPKEAGISLLFLFLFFCIIFCCSESIFPTKSWKKKFLELDTDILVLYLRKHTHEQAQPWDEGWKIVQKFALGFIQTTSALASSTIS